MERRDDATSDRDQARRLRQRMTIWERTLWRGLRDHRLTFHWRRQHPVMGYVLDFYCDSVRLCVEVDGQGHDPVKDQIRDENLAELGILTLRFTNEQVGNEPEKCFEQILFTATNRSGRFG